jgi:hypothetical protein
MEIILKHHFKGHRQYYIITSLFGTLCKLLKKRYNSSTIKQFLCHEIHFRFIFFDFNF